VLFVTSGLVVQTGTTFAAWRPFGPCTRSNSTVAPSASERKPLALIAEKWTNTSSPPSIVMNPKPFASLNHFTVPVLRIDESSPFRSVLLGGRLRGLRHTPNPAQASRDVGTNHVWWVIISKIALGQGLQRRGLR